MSEELFDLLDEEGNPIGLTKPRSAVHRDGDWHRVVHVWIINECGEVLLQRRCAKKDSYPDMLDISCAGHLSAGDDSLTGALRELKEELDLKVKKNELVFIQTLKNSTKLGDDFLNNQLEDVYILRTNKTIDDMNIQEEEVSEIVFIPYKKFKEMVNRKQPDLLIRKAEFALLFEVLDKQLRIE